jgi:hypothetical protein
MASEGELALSTLLFLRRRFEARARQNRIGQALALDLDCAHRGIQLGDLT